MATLNRQKNYKKINKSKDRSKDYLDNKEFNKEVIKFLKSKRKTMNNTLAKMFILLIDNLAKKPNFKNYPFLDDMKQNAFETILKYIHNFDPVKSDNPFSYFTTMVYNSFLVTIKREKKRLEDHGEFCDWMIDEQEEEIKSQNILKNKNGIKLME